MRKLSLLPLLLFVALSLPAHAACTGSGAVWSCPAGATSSDVQNAIDAASDGATITFAAGSYTWRSPIYLSMSAAAQLICASQGACVVAAGAPALGMSTMQGTASSHLYRISGFVFNGQGGGAVTIWFCTSCAGNTATVPQFRIDHNTFNLPSGGEAIWIGEGTSQILMYGVVDHNTFQASGAGSILALSVLDGYNLAPIGSRLGTANNIFFEDNTVTVTTMDNAGLGAVDGRGIGMGVVIRHNTITNALLTAHASYTEGGAVNYEVYNNTLIQNSGSQSPYSTGYRMIHHQGSGTIMIFNNTFTSQGHDGDAIALMHYRDYANSCGTSPPAQCDGTLTAPQQDGLTDGNYSPTSSNYGYPCWHQPARLWNGTPGTLYPIYVWNNRWSDNLSKVDLNFETGVCSAPDYSTFHVQANRDFYNAVSTAAQTSPTAPFNGSTGMGFGTLANRPTTCSTGNTAPQDAGHGGVGYFATDAGPQGTLFMCNSTNTWSAYYTPYTYPHPLVSGAAVLEAPPNVRKI
jgi:hypothetical protein